MDITTNQKQNIIAEAQAACSIPLQHLDKCDQVQLKRIVATLGEKVLIERQHVAGLLPAAETLLHNRQKLGKKFIEIDAAVEKVKAQRKAVAQARAAAKIVD